MRAALVVAHPGHELLVHGWLEQAKPRVFIFTDGSGRLNRSRLDSTTKILEQTGAQRGGIYGRFTDLAAYSAILNHDFGLFVQLAEELAATLSDERIDYVAGDAAEGYNPVHDVCRLVINAAVEIASSASGRQIANFEFSLINQPGGGPQSLQGEALRLRLDEDAFERKMAAARGYAEMAGEVQAALARNSVDAFRAERLYPFDKSSGKRFLTETPFYESHGEKQVAAGHYHQVLRYREHIEPLAETLAALCGKRLRIAKSHSL